MPQQPVTSGAVIMSFGVTGTLFPSEFVSTRLSRVLSDGATASACAKAEREFARWWKTTFHTLGPAASLRTLCTRGALPLLEIFGWHRAPYDEHKAGTFLSVAVHDRGGSPIPLLIGDWNVPLDGSWRDAVRAGLAVDARWALSFNGTHLQLIDAERTYARRFADFELECAAADSSAFRVLWSVIRADALAAAGAQSTRAAVVLADQHAASVCSSLREGVRQAVETTASAVVRHAVRRDARKAAATAFGESLTVIYRILFLLFAEARHLVPVWHPVYRDSYSVGTMCDAVRERRAATGIWEGLQATMRLAHAGCDAGDLKVFAFNGRLFAPARAPIAASAPLPDEAVASALRALTTREDRESRTMRRISFGDLGVEQLGAVYEHVLDYEPRIIESRNEPTSRTSRLPPVVALEHRAGASARKTTATFYTPRSITDFLVRRTLYPLVHRSTTSRILALRVLDPAMGSGAFLVSACRYLASAYESAAVAEGQFSAHDLTEGDRAGFRRLIAQRCLFGVDVNPTAVELAKLSLWLTTLAAGKPLNFLDHHLRAGDSLIGASVDDVMRRLPASARRRRAASELPLFGPESAGEVMGAATAVRLQLSERADDTASVVREKETEFRRLMARDAALARWKAVLDLWCATWFWNDARTVASRGMFGALAQQLLGSAGDLPQRLAAPTLQRSEQIAASYLFFHWTLEFPEVFYAPDGQPLATPGFDAILGNPPWDVVRADMGDADARRLVRRDASGLVRFVRESGTYSYARAGHPNRYQLFLERALKFLRPGGRLGLVLPSGLLTDTGSAPLRRALLDGCATDLLVTFDNRDGLFPIHRSVRFAAITATAGGGTASVHCRFGERDPTTLDRLPDRGAGTSGGVTLTPSLIARVSGPDLTIPDVRTAVDVAMVDRVSATVPPLESPHGWNIRFGRELNASDNRQDFVIGKEGESPPHGSLLPVIEGKHLAPFRVYTDRTSTRIAAQRAAELLDPDATFARPRLAYRDVASATNRLTLIAAIVPAGVVTTHTIFCIKTRLSDDDQHVLCGLLNSYVANYLVRQRVTTHVSAAILAHLQVPFPTSDDHLRRLIVRLTRRLCDRQWDPDAHARLQAAAAHLYGLTRDQFAHVLTTFPLIEESAKQTALAHFEG